MKDRIIEIRSTGLRPMEVNESRSGRRFYPEYDYNAPVCNIIVPEYDNNALKYDKNGNKQNFTLGIVGVSERIFRLLESANISFCVI